MLYDMKKYLPQLYALGFFCCAFALSLLLEIPFDIAKTDNYWIDHFIFGVGFPFFIYAFSSSFKLGVFVALTWSIGNEFWEDQLDRLEFKVDWDHFFADMVGIFVAYLIFKYFWQPKLPNQALKRTP